jgi:excisionase family DNA binding protein
MVKQTELNLQDEPAFRTGRAADYMGMGHSTLNKLRRQGRSPAYIVIGSRKYLWRQSDLDAYLDARRIEPALTSNEEGRP